MTASAFKKNRCSEQRSNTAKLIGKKSCTNSEVLKFQFFVECPSIYVALTHKTLEQF